MESPPAPDFGTLRLARLSDLTRMAVVATAGYYHTAKFHYERPFAAKYVGDTLAGYKETFRSDIIDPKVVVLVAEAELYEREKDLVYEALRQSYPPWSDQIRPEDMRSGKIIVGITSLSFPEGSARMWQFQPEGNDNFEPIRKLPDRDKSPKAVEEISATMNPIIEILFANRMTIEEMVVHPAYWRSGHGTTMLKWHLALAEQDKVGIAVGATELGMLLYKHLRFLHIKTFSFPAYDENSKTVAVWICNEPGVDLDANLPRIDPRVDVGPPL